MGETVRFHVRTSQDAYVTLVNIGTSGAVTVLFPNRFHPSHAVAAGQTESIPAAAAGFDLVIQGPPGFEHVRAIATDRPVKFLPADFTGQKEALRGLAPAEARELTRDIRMQKSQVAPSNWAEDVVVVRVR